MAMIDLEFEGRIMGVEVTEAYDKDGNVVDVSRLTPYELAQKIENKELTVSFKFAVNNSIDLDVHLVGCYPSRYRVRDIKE